MKGKLPRPLATSLGIGFVVIALDQYTKYRILHGLEIGESIPVIPNFFAIVFVCNTGAAWGMFADKTMFLAALSAIVFLVIAVYFRRVTEDLPERVIAIALVLSGIGGNLIDRLWHRCVVDFLSFSFRSFEWPAFNVADSAICCGVGLYLLSSFLRPETTSNAKDSQT